MRDLAERGVLQANRAPTCAERDAADVQVPASLQAAIAARIDRLGPTAKRTLNARGGHRVAIRRRLARPSRRDVELAELVAADLIDQVRSRGPLEYAFRHPMIRTVAYESQLKADRAQLHRALAAAIEEDPRHRHECRARRPAPRGGRRSSSAYQWHMRAGTWAQFRDARAATSELAAGRRRRRSASLTRPGRNRHADRTPRPARGERRSDSAAASRTGFEELRDSASSLAIASPWHIGMAGMLTGLIFHNRFREAARVATDASTWSSRWAIGPLTPSVCGTGQRHGPSGQVIEGLRMAQRAIELAERGSPGTS